MNTIAPPIILSSHDVRRLERLLETAGPQFREVVAALEDELVRAEVRAPEDMPPDTVTMNSRVLCVDETSGAEHVLQLVYPRDADPAQGKVSVLAPVGAALLGLSAGQAIDWPLPGGRSTRLRVLRVIDQPEAHGRLD
ncbi:nucleoside diphosphate kinase regulator [Immundisolibacter sp.]|uniref:nucleoside diphosphate kinase regulator n=1 Tax=Immundisolibacter sp. TaxID=1934948 RepID=UPI0026371613|nr:nucleoside diphosphate kinase regulator [Immundisolibacter sp.]MDD3650168.1 nucleoside diphosphate kinase regulator [Immundisolibacter sp.]